MRKAILPLALLMVASVAAADDTEVFDRTLSLRAGSEVEIANVNGRIAISSWDQPQVRIHAVKTVRTSDDDAAKDALRALRIEIKQTSRGVSIDTIYPKRNDSGLFGGLFGSNINASVQYELTVPRQADLNVDNVNGAIEVADVTGKLNLETTNGRVRVLRCGGALNASTTNGAIEAELLRVTSGESMTFETTNGHISLTVPPSLAADINAGTTNGSIRSDLPLATTRFSRTSLRGTMNGGGPEIKLRTTNGGIDIRGSEGLTR